MGNGKKKLTPQEKQDSTQINQAGMYRAKLISGEPADSINTAYYNNAFNKAARTGVYNNLRDQVSNINAFQDQGSKAGAEYYQKIGFKNKDVNFLDRAASGIRQGVAKFIGRGFRF